MNMSGEETPIRIVKKKKGHAGHHGGAWKVAYADFVTAMMALFIVLWIVGQSKQVKQYVADYFKDPGAFFENTGGGGPFQGQSLVSLDMKVEEALKREKQKMEEIEKAISEGLGKDPKLKILKDQIKIEIIEEGLRIELLESTHAFFFDVGTAILKPDAVEALTIIAKEIGRMPNRVAIEGHTDSRQYSSVAGYTNFELSSDRANSARRVLAAQGLMPGQLEEIRGFADTRLRNSKDPLDAINRRISIIIKKQEGKKGNVQSTDHPAR
jgi:chemotaxis protein MotB